MWKFIKRVLIGNLIVDVIAGIAIFIAILIALDSAKLIDLDDFGIIDKFLSTSYARPHSSDVSGMLQSCEEIAQFYLKNHYTYNKDDPPWDVHYRDGNYKTSCCSIYVLQVLIDIGLTEDLGDLDAEYVGTLCDSHPELWYKFTAQSEADLAKGDIQLYIHHTNIFAGMDEHGVRTILGCWRKWGRCFYRTD